VRMKLDLVGGMVVDLMLIQRVRIVNLRLIPSGALSGAFWAKALSLLLAHRSQFSLLWAGLRVCHRVFILEWPNLNKRCLSWLFLHRALPFTRPIGATDSRYFVCSIKETASIPILENSGL